MTVCPHCALCPPPYRQLAFYGVYRDELQDLIRLYKYSEVERLGRFMAERMADLFHRRVRDHEQDLILPVPRDRKRRRGFDPAGRLALLLGKKLNIPVKRRVLIKTRSTRPQVLLRGRDREKNLRGVFALVRPQTLKKRKVMLIDDVTTTQSTIRECCRVLLREAGEVTVMTMARTLYHY